LRVTKNRISFRLSYDAVLDGFDGARRKPE
jgi:hypothetical protein